MQSPWLENLSCKVLGRPTGNAALSAAVFYSRKSVVTGGPMKDLGKRTGKANPSTAGPTDVLWTEDH